MLINYENIVKCPLCGNKIQIDMSKSVFELELSDLDLRPQYNAQKSLLDTVDICPECGYCGDLRTPIKNKRAIARLCEEKISKKDLHRIFERCAEIEELENGHTLAVADLYLKAAWAADDLRKKDFAENMRKMFLKKLFLFERLNNEIPKNFIVMAIDAARRTSQWQKAKQYLLANLNAADSRVYKNIISYQYKLIKSEDSKCAKISDSEIYAEKSKVVRFDYTDIKDFRILFCNLEIAGLYYHKEIATEFSLTDSEDLKLSAVFEPTNQFDVNAIAILFKNQILGYVPKTITFAISKMPKELKNNLYIILTKRTLIYGDGVSIEFDILEKTNKLKRHSETNLIKIKPPQTCIYY